MCRHVPRTRAVPAARCPLLTCRAVPCRARAVLRFQTHVPFQVTLLFMVSMLVHPYHPAIGTSTMLMTVMTMMMEATVADMTMKTIWQ